MHFQHRGFFFLQLQLRRRPLRKSFCWVCANMTTPRCENKCSQSIGNHLEVYVPINLVWVRFKTWAERTVQFEPDFETRVGFEIQKHMYGQEGNQAHLQPHRWKTLWWTSWDNLQRKAACLGQTKVWSNSTWNSLQLSSWFDWLPLRSIEVVKTERIHQRWLLWSDD